MKEGFTQKTETTTEKIETILRYNERYQQVMEKLKQEYERRVGHVQQYIQQVEEQCGSVKWFIAPPVSNRTDYGYTGDVDIVILKNKNQCLPVSDDDDVYIFAVEVDTERLQHIASTYPDLGAWLQKKFKEIKPKGDISTAPVEVYELEDDIRSATPDALREDLRRERIQLAEDFITQAKEKINIIGWSVSGSTAESSNRLAINSDVDIEILVNAETADEEMGIEFYLHQYLKKKFTEEYNVKIDFTVFTLSHLKKMIGGDEEKKKVFEQVYNTKL